MYSLLLPLFLIIEKIAHSLAFFPFLFSKYLVHTA